MTIKFFEARILLILFLCGYLVVSLSTYKTYGLTNDEPVEYLMGKFWYIKMRADDPVLEKSFLLYEGDNPDIVFYNHWYAGLLYTLNPAENFATYHLLNLLFLLLLFIFSYEALFSQGRNSYLSLLGPIFLVLTPRFFGAAATNPKDMPFAVLYLISLLLIYLTSDYKSSWRILILGISFGLTASLRLIGYSIYFIFFCFEAISSKNKSKRLKNLLYQTLPKTLQIFSIGLLIHLLTQPYLAADPASNFLKLFSLAREFPWQQVVLFAGHLVTATDLPWQYLPVWLLITTPLFILFFSFWSLEFIRQSKLAQLMWLAILLNLSFYFFLRPVIYDGLRHFLFVVTILSFLAASTFIQIWQQRAKFRIIISGLFIINAILVISSYWQLFPFQYIYFNELVGGVAGAQNSYELDYWGASYRELVTWTNENRAQLPAEINLFTCADPLQISYHAQFTYNLVTDRDKANVIFCHRRGSTLEQLKIGYSIYAVKRLGVTLAEIKVL